jgi:hypothetical protein
VLKTGRYVRSHPADNRNDKGRAYWQNADVDGDGQMGYMRQKCGQGELVELKDENGNKVEPGMLVPRQPEDTGPFYRVYPEGHIVNFDGHHIPTPNYMGDTQTDFNRNFPYQWGSQDVQIGAGAYPGSEPETRAILEFVSAHPNIYTWVNYHTFGGVFLRPRAISPTAPGPGRPGGVQAGGAVGRKADRLSHRQRLSRVSVRTRRRRAA